MRPNHGASAHWKLPYSLRRFNITLANVILWLTILGSARASAFKKFTEGNPSVLIATPGRLKDYLSEGAARVKFANLRTLILDEADRMLEQGFLQDVKEILTLLPPKSSGWQGMCFSATVPDKVKDVLEVVLKPGYTTISTIDESEAPTHTR